MTDNEMVEKYTEVSVNEYKDSLVDIDDIDILKEAIAEAYFAGLKEQTESYKAFESHCDEIEEDAKVIAKENEDLKKQVEELKAKIEQLADCSNCKHWHYSARSLSFYCDCSDMISNSTDSRTYEHCDKWELE